MSSTRPKSSDKEGENSRVLRQTKQQDKVSAYGKELEQHIQSEDAIKNSE